MYTRELPTFPVSYSYIIFLLAAMSGISGIGLLLSTCVQSSPSKTRQCFGLFLTIACIGIACSAMATNGFVFFFFFLLGNSCCSPFLFSLLFVFFFY
jgi:hypothetical protein